MRDFFRGKLTGTAVDEFFSFLFAVSPILIHYKGPFINAGITVLILLFPYEIYKILKRPFMKGRDFMLIVPLLLYWGFKILDHGTSVTEMGQVMIYAVLVLVYAAGMIDPKHLVKMAVLVACFASVCIIVQYICYYLLHFHLQLVPTRLLLSSAGQWVKLAQTGRISITGKAIAFYRPSAFFLEPSHMFIYLCAPLYHQLLAPVFGKEEKRRAVLLTVGMLFSTSGMGILAAAGGWLLFFGKRRGDRAVRLSLSNFLQPGTLLLFGSLLVLGLALFFNVGFFQKSILRIFSSGSDYKNAVSGRVSEGMAFIGQLRGKELLIGLSDHYSEVEFHMTAFNATMYKYGIIGTVLSYVFYVRSALYEKDAYRWIAVLLIIASFFNPHTHGTIYMLFFVVFLLDGYKAEGTEYITAPVPAKVRWSAEK